MFNYSRTPISPDILLWRKLQSFAPCPAEPLRELLADRTIQQSPAASELLHNEARLLTDGWVIKARRLSNGLKQIVEIHLPGDIICNRPADRCGLSAVTAASTLNATALIAAAAHDEVGLTPAWELSMAAQEAHVVDHMVRLGVMPAYERTLHLLLELHERLLRVGLAGETTFAMPLTQEVLGQVLGMSIVHVNRTLQQLRRDGLIDYRARRMQLKGRSAAADLVGYPISVWPERRVKTEVFGLGLPGAA